eukprot:gene2154-38941_t
MSEAARPPSALSADEAEGAVMVDSLLAIPIDDLMRMYPAFLASGTAHFWGPVWGPSAPQGLRDFIQNAIDNGNFRRAHALGSVRMPPVPQSVTVSPQSPGAAPDLPGREVYGMRAGETARAPGKMCNAAALVVTPGPRILLVFSRKRGGWELPGGKMEKKVKVTATALRELREEAHVDLSAADVIDHAGVLSAAGDGLRVIPLFVPEERVTEVAVGARPAPPPDEAHRADVWDVARVEWFDPAELPSPLSFPDDAALIPGWVES